MDPDRKEGHYFETQPKKFKTKADLFKSNKIGYYVISLDIINDLMCRMYMRCTTFKQYEGFATRF